MVWTSTASPEFYRRFVRQHRDLFREDTVEEAERSARFRQARLGDFEAAA